MITTTEYDYHRFPNRQTEDESRENLKVGDYRTVYFGAYEKDFGTYSVKVTHGRIHSVAGKTFKVYTSSENSAGNVVGYKIPFSVLLAVI